jgi:hypothetical protein
MTLSQVLSATVFMATLMQSLHPAHADSLLSAKRFV